ncbi:hypothetical protein PR048_002324 [Dryococelus australis]|uniref:Uncharacterized protein n=1 Tax=Dryococelus australis TaxID=614101 RepID=A0ABQ9IMC9_9NEOP|nr:hypothetical protein PR048_002324 [Dryococelus australis]
MVSHCPKPGRQESLLPARESGHVALWHADMRAAQDGGRNLSPCSAGRDGNHKKPQFKRNITIRFTAKVSCVMGMEQCRNERTGETGDPRENPVASSNTIPHKLKSGSDPAGNRSRLLASHKGEPGSTTRPVHSGFSYMAIVQDDAAGRRVFVGDFSFHQPLHCASPFSPHITLIGSQDLDLLSDFFRRSRIFARGNRSRRRCWSAGFLEDIPFPPPLHFGAALYSSRFTHIGSQDIDVKCRPILFTH